MHAGVPQFIDVEDKIAFGLTAKQLLWIGGGAAILVAVYSLFDIQLFYVLGFFILILTGALAFWRPQGMSLISFSGFTLRYLFNPKNYIWRRVYSNKNIDIRKASLAQTKNAAAPFVPKHLPSRGQLRRISWELDTKK